jgi:hypothetical protein
MSNVFEPSKKSGASPQTNKWLCALNQRLETIRADAGCSMLDTGYKHNKGPYQVLSDNMLQGI